MKQTKTVKQPGQASEPNRAGFHSQPRRESVALSTHNGQREARYFHLQPKGCARRRLQVDVSTTAKEAGFTVPVFMTLGVYDKLAKT